MMGRILVFAILSGWAALAAQSPAETRIAAARRAIAQNPRSYQAHNDLAMAFARRARETADTKFYAQAAETLKESFRLQPDNFEGRKAEVWILLGRHQFRTALDQATILNKRAPDDVQVYGFLVDANVELGNYKEAEEAAQWMLNLRPGSVAALTRTAYLREIFGDLDGAMDLMNDAFVRTPPAETEDRAWILTHAGHLLTLSAKLEAAERVLNEALRLFPDYHYALAGLAVVRQAQGRHSDAVSLLRKRYQAAPHPENLHALAEALERTGAKDEAAAAYKEFEAMARKEMEGFDNANRELIAYYTGAGRNPAAALRIAEMEISRRKDIHTRAAYALALKANGRHDEARREMEIVMKVGVRDPRLIEQARGLQAAGN